MHKVWLVNEGLGCLWFSPNRYQQVPTLQAIGTWLRCLSKDNQGIKALRKANKTLLKATITPSMFAKK
jgi:hypothetical protein